MTRYRKLLASLAAAVVASAALAAGVITQSGPRYIPPPPTPPTSGSLLFVSNTASNYEYVRLQTMPANFGAGEFAVSLWVQLTTGTASSYAFGDAAERTDWSAHDVQPYSAADWWYHGNFLLDGHTNAGSAFYDGTFSLQVVGSGRIRWLFGDGAAANARTGDVHAVQAWPSSGTASLRDGNWHHIVCVRRFDGGTGSILELWIDGSMVASETSTARTNMYTAYWDDFAAQAAAQRGWFFGSEKQAAVGVLTQYADFKGRIAEPALINRAPSSGEIAAWSSYTPSNFTSLTEVWRLAENTGSTATGDNGATMSLNNGASGQTVAWGTSDPF